MSERRWLLLLLGLYLLITTGYGALNPLFEAPDEQLHYFTVQMIAETGNLPQVADEPDPWMGQEAAQPPLYYVVGAALIAPLDTDDAKEMVWFNPYVRLGDAGSPTNHNAFVHPPAESWPWSGYVLAGHLLRLFSTLLGLGTLICLYQGGKLIWPAQPERALLATAVVAFLPQFNFLHAAISNDPLIILACAAALWQLLRLWFQGVTTGRLILLGFTIGLAILSKTAGLLILAFSGLWLLIMAWQRTSLMNRKTFLPTVVKWELAAIIPAGLLGFPLLWRNWTLYGDITATSQFIRLAGGDRGYTLGQVIGETGGLWRSIFAVFGWMNIAPPAWIYAIWYGLVVLAIAGALVALVRARRANPNSSTITARQAFTTHIQKSIPYYLLALWVILIYAGLVQFMLHTPAAQGRLLFPAMLPLATGMAAGLAQYRQRWLIIFAPVLALSTTLFCLVVVIPQAYAHPPLIEATQIPAGANQLAVDLGHGLTLVTAEIETETAQPGEQAWLTLYWQSDRPPEEAPHLVVELFGREWDLIGKLQTYHGGGLYPANLWPAGPVIADQLGLQMAADVVLPVAVPVQVRLVDGEAPVIVGYVKLVPENWPETDQQPLAVLGDSVALLQVDVLPNTARPGDEITLHVTWLVNETLGQDFTTFFHLGQPDQPPIASGDGPPLAGFYPTRFWEPGEWFSDEYTLTLPDDLPPGQYPVWLGMYNETGRLPIMANGERQPHDAYPAGWVTVEIP